MEFDLVYCGFGVSARLLASQLDKRLPKSTTCLALDVNFDHKKPECFSYWIKGNHDYAGLVDRQFKCLCLNSKKRLLGKYRMETISVKRLFIQTNSLPGVKYVKSQVLKITWQHGKYLIDTDKDIIAAKRVIDSRQCSEDDSLYMSDKIINDKNVATDCVGLMNNLRYENDKICFEYIFPVVSGTERHFVGISKNKPPRELRCIELCKHQHLERIPGVIYIGSVAGWLKISTGYSIPRSVVETPKVVQAILNNHNYVYSQGKFYRLCDIYLYRLMKNHPEQAITFINSILEAEPDSLLAFLNEEATIYEIFQVLKKVVLGFNPVFLFHH